MARDGYNSEKAQFGLAGVAPTVRDITIQRTILLSDNSHATAVLTPDDLGRWTSDPYEGDYCGPCKAITISPSHDTRVGVTVQWTGAPPLSIWGVGVKAAAEPGAPSMNIAFDLRAGTLYTVLIGVSSWATGLKLPGDVTLDVTTTDLGSHSSTSSSGAGRTESGPHM